MVLGCIKSPFIYCVSSHAFFFVNYLVLITEFVGNTLIPVHFFTFHPTVGGGGGGH